MSQSKYLLGFDIGSSFIKVSVIHADTGELAGGSQSPGSEMKMESPQPGWAEQSPDMWWENLVSATRQLFTEQPNLKDNIAAVGITYQMHGLVAVDKNHQVLRDSIIWCDSRAAGIGHKAFREIGEDTCLKNFLNSPGNFTASKLKWVQDNEPEVYEKIHKIMLPGDYIAMKLTGRICTTVSGLSEGIFWNFRKNETAGRLLEYYGISEELIPEALPSFGVQGALTQAAAEATGIPEGTPVSYRAGDQPNNAFSLKVTEPGEVATTAGTSGVIYGIIDHPGADEKSRVNTFVHVSHSPEEPRYGVLLCINGTGILNSWLRKTLSVSESLTYEEMNRLAREAPVGSDGAVILPFGNGAERIFENRNIGAQFYGLNFNRHHAGHILRAAQEGIVYSMNYGFKIMQGMGMKTDTVKAGKANMFLSPLFREAFVNTTGTTLELYNTDGAQGAARGAGVGAGVYGNTSEAFEGLRLLEVEEPDPGKQAMYEKAYQDWYDKLKENNNIE